MKNIAFASLAIALAAGIAQADIYTGGTGGAIPDSAGNNVSGPVALFTLAAANGANPTISSFNGIAIGMNHTFVGDLLITITSPGGQTADVLVRPGVTSATTFGNGGDFSFASGNAYVFVNSGGTPFPTTSSGVIPTGTYNRSPAANGTVVATGASGNDFSVFAGGDVNGVWTLSVRDFANQDTGNIVGWSLDITTVPTPGAAALLGLGGLMAGRRRR